MKEFIPKNITYTCYINSTAHKTRQEWAVKCANFIDQQNFNFDKKIVCFDEFNNNTVDSDILKILNNSNWETIIVNNHNRPHTLKHVLDLEHNDIFLYIEDDVLVELPDKQDVDNIFNTLVNNRECGFLTMSVGGGGFDSHNNSWGDLQHIDQNTLVDNNKYIFFLRDENYKTPYFFEFPVMFIQTTLFKKCVDFVIEKIKGQQIECALTSSWFLQNLDKKFYKASMAKNNSLQILKNNMHDVTKITFLSYLDPHQGNGSWGGNHFT